MSEVVPPRRGRKPSLDAGRVIDAALDLLDREGARAVSFRRIASVLGVSHMTIYGYFASKDALLEALAAATIDVPSMHPHGHDAEWHVTLLGAIQEIHGALARRPYIAEILVSKPFDGYWIQAVRDPLVTLMRQAGFDETQARDGLSMIFNYLLGAVLIDARRPRGGSVDSFTVGLRHLINGLDSSLA